MPTTIVTAETSKAVANNEWDHEKARAAVIRQMMKEEMPITEDGINELISIAYLRHAKWGTNIGGAIFWAVKDLQEGNVRASGSSDGDIMNHRDKYGNKATRSHGTESDDGSIVPAINDAAYHCGSNNPAVIGAWRIDFQTYESRLTARERDIVAKVLDGNKATEIADHYGVTRGRMSQLMSGIRRKTRNFFHLEVRAAG